MRRPTCILRCLLTAAALIPFAGTAVAESRLSLPAIFGENMVLQRSDKTPLWGLGTPGEMVTVRVGSVTGTIAVPDNGKWRLDLDLSQLPGDPIDVQITAGDQTITYRNVLVGEVWLASGQSNMEWSVANVQKADNEIEGSANDRIRHFAVTKRVSETPLEDLSGRWEIASPKTTGRFTAVGYFFARELQPAINQPIGIINSSWGGTPSEAWTSDEGLTAFPEFAERIQQRNAAMADPAASQKRYQQELDAWEQAHLHQDAGDAGAVHRFAETAVDLSGWKRMNLPGNWESAGLEIDGAVWFRRDIDVPESWAGKPVEIKLGPIDDFDATYLNGKLVGRTGKDTAEYWSHPRQYRVPADVIRSGRNVVAVRVFDHGGQGGIDGLAEQMQLTTEGETPIALAGEWSYRVEVELPQLDPNVWSTRPNPPAANAHSPGVLFYGMIRPLIPFRIRGAIWYQGESNAWRAQQYRAIFPAMVRDWRAQWGQGDFPFLFVQLANFTPRATEPGNSDWAELRDAQLATLAEPKTGMAIAIDIGEADDIHPRNKQEVGRRLALAARAVAYDQDVRHTGPRLAKTTIEGKQIRLEFDLVGDGLKTRDGASPKGFAVAGADRKWYWADAKLLDGRTIVVESEHVPSPVGVRYAWSNNPDATLTDSDGLPATPFRTDDFPPMTGGNR